MKMKLFYIILGIFLFSKAYSQTYTLCCSQTIYAGDTANMLTVTPSAPVYQWMYHNADTSTASSTIDNLLKGMTQTTYFSALLHLSMPSYPYYYYSSTNVDTITVLPEFSPGIIESDKLICYNKSGGILGFATTPSGGDSSYTYKWMIAEPNGVFSYIPGGTNSSIDVGVLTSTKRYRCEVDGGAGVKYTNESVIRISSNFNQGVIGNNQELCYNTSAATITNVSDPTGGVPPYNYLWQYSPNGTSDWKTVGTDISYFPGIITDTSYFWRMVTDACGNDDVSNVVRLTVRDKLSDPLTDLKQIYCKNDSVKIRVINHLESNNWYDDQKVFILNDTLFNKGAIAENRTMYLNSLDDKGCSTDTVEIKVVIDPVKAAFRIANTSINSGDSVCFINLSEKASVYAWDFGNGEKSSLMEPISFYYNVGWYAVNLKVTSSNSCSDSTTISNAVRVLSESSIGEEENETIFIYPLPVIDNLFIEYSGVSVAKVFIYNISGQVILEENLEKAKNCIDMSSFQGGSYVLKIVSKDQKEYSRVIIKK